MDGDYVVAHVYFRLTMFLLSSIFVLSRSCCPLPWAATFKEIDQHVKVHGQLVAEDIDKERFRATCLIGYCGLTWTGKQSRSPISWVFNMLKTHENTQSLLTNACATMPASNGNDRQFFRYVLQRLPVFERHHLEKDISSESLIFSDMFLDGFLGGHRHFGPLDPRWFYPGDEPSSQEASDFWMTRTSEQSSQKPWLFFGWFFHKAFTKDPKKKQPGFNGKEFRGSSEGIV